MNELTKERLAEIEAQCEVAKEDLEFICKSSPDIQITAVRKQRFNARSAGHIAALLSCVKELLAEVERLTRELKRCTTGNGTYISIEAYNHLRAENEKLQEALKDAMVIAEEARRIIKAKEDQDVNE
jgi:hypothetical protein